MRKYKPVKRHTRFIEDGSGTVYLPRPSSWWSGFIRNRWVERTLKKKCSVVGARQWCEIGKKHMVNRLFGYYDITWEIIVYEDQ